MRPLRLALLAAGLLIAITPGTGSAQGQDCELLPGAREATRRIVDGEEYIYVSGPARFVCPGDVVLQADSAVGSRSLGEVELIGHVFFQDSVKTLTAAWARYLRDDAKLFAREEVVLTDRKSGSTIEGTELEYLPANELRPETEAIVLGRPHATFYQERNSESATGDSVPEPLEVDADIMRIYGETRFVALGQVEMIRGETRGFGREGEFDQAREFMLLSGDARLEGDGYDLVGERIEAVLDGESLQKVNATGQAALLAEDIDIEGHELRIFFESDKLNRLVAMGTPRESGPVEAMADSSDTAVETELTVPEPFSAQPVVTSREFRLAADSIDVIAPGQELEMVIAVGRASGVRATDTLDLGLPEVISRDWLVGDTITGFFTSVPDTEAESEPDPVPEPDPDSEIMTDTSLVASTPRERTVLERLVAVGDGGRARSLYRIREKGREAEPPSANYLVANRIVLVMSEGEVRDVEAEGPIEGIHLQPEGAPGGPPGEQGSTGADAPAKPAVEPN